MKLFSCSNQLSPYLLPLYGRKNIADLRRFDEVLANFRRLFGGSQAHVVSSPGRLELIGNHLDHNGGKVVACTVNLDILAAFLPNDRQQIRICGNGRSTVTLRLDDRQHHGRSAGLVLGVVQYLQQNGYNVGGFDAYTDSVIPTGAGVSSSAAFELAVGAILSALYNQGAIPAETLARAGQYAEVNFFGKPCGLLDQSVIAIGGAVLLDFADGLRHTRLALPSDPVPVLINSGGSHSQLSALYAQIPADMHAVARFFCRQRLVDVPPDAFFAAFDAVVRQVGELPALRARHFFTEQARVQQFADMLSPTAERPDDARPDIEHPDIAKLISLVDASGQSSLCDLRNCAADEHDTAIADIISLAHSLAPCAARVHGGGFAGTVLCLVPRMHLDAFVSAAAQQLGADKILPLRLRSLPVTVL